MMNIVALRRPPPAACQPPVPRAAANWHLALVGNKGRGLVADAQAGKHQFLVGKDCLGHNLVAIGRLLRRTAPGISVRAAAERLDASICDDCVHTGCTCGQPERVSHAVELPQKGVHSGQRPEARGWQLRVSHRCAHCAWLSSCHSAWAHQGVRESGAPCCFVLHQARLRWTRQKLRARSGSVVSATVSLLQRNMSRSVPEACNVS